jgi:hypothetical protein
VDIVQVLENAERGNLEFCVECAWSPASGVKVGFGVSCIEHGLDWRYAQKANSMTVVQDPGNTTPSTTGRLCMIHNAKNPSDKTAQQSLQLWNAAVSMKHDDPGVGGYLKKHYWTNAIMHGVVGNPELREKSVMKNAEHHCSNVLGLQIQALRPNVVIAMGVVAVNSLYEVGVLRENWRKITRKHDFLDGAYREEVRGWKGLSGFTVFATYHTAARIVNQTLSRLYDPKKTEKKIEEKAIRLGNPASVEQFLSLYANPAENTRARGMRYLLNHWLDIGVEIRECAAT